ncbi:hypothetical protein Cgig2_001991 [Carnegiea gigantea]|uniref:Uncharacterized protein n=1 Tax=Carnegiea gigantea TaxID=171969 RepID=A0A9Q1GQF8_9CARY|nr:hypothetical protein Cgig2_001991 [Carnegiea gigantea]
MSGLLQNSYDNNRDLGFDNVEEAYYLALGRSLKCRLRKLPTDYDSLDMMGYSQFVENMVAHAQLASSFVTPLEATVMYDFDDLRPYYVILWYKLNGGDSMSESSIYSEYVLEDIKASKDEVNIIGVPIKDDGSGKRKGKRKIDDEINKVDDDAEVVEILLEEEVDDDLKTSDEEWDIARCRKKQKATEAEIFSSQPSKSVHKGKENGDGKHGREHEDSNDDLNTSPNSGDDDEQSKKE